MRAQQFTALERKKPRPVSNTFMYSKYITQNTGLAISAICVRPADRKNHAWTT